MATMYSGTMEYQDHGYGYRKVTDLLDWRRRNNRRSPVPPGVQYASPLPPGIQYNPEQPFNPSAELQNQVQEPAIRVQELEIRVPESPDWQPDPQFCQPEHQFRVADLQYRYSDLGFPQSESVIRTNEFQEWQKGRESEFDELREGQRLVREGQEELRHSLGDLRRKIETLRAELNNQLIPGKRSAWELDGSSSLDCNGRAYLHQDRYVRIPYLESSLNSAYGSNWNSCVNLDYSNQGEYEHINHHYQPSGIVVRKSENSVLFESSSLVDLECNGKNSVGYENEVHEAVNVNIEHRDLVIEDLKVVMCSEILENEPPLSSSLDDENIEGKVEEVSNVDVALECEDKGVDVHVKEGKFDADLLVFDKSMEFREEMGQTVEKICKFEVKEQEMVVESKFLDVDISVTNQRKILPSMVNGEVKHEPTLKFADECEVFGVQGDIRTDVGIWDPGITSRKVGGDDEVEELLIVEEMMSSEIVATIGKTDVFEVEKRCLEDHGRFTLEVGAKLTKANKNHEQQEQFVDTFMLLSYKMLVVECVQRVRVATQLDYKRYRKKLYAMGEMVRSKVWKFQS